MAHTVKRGHEGYQIHTNNGMLCDGMIGNDAVIVARKLDAYDDLLQAAKVAMECIHADLTGHRMSRDYHMLWTMLDTAIHKAEGEGKP